MQLLVICDADEDSMGTYTGTNGGDSIVATFLSAGVIAVPEGSYPSDQPDFINGLAGIDSLSGDGGKDTLHGGDCGDSLFGDYGNDVLWGEGEDDGLWGGNDNDLLYGGNGNDNLSGEEGNDLLDGGGGRDYLHGGLGKDYNAVSDSVVGENREQIPDFESGVDKIDVSTIDANVNLAGNQAFEFKGTASPTGAGQITLIDAPDPSGGSPLEPVGDTIIQLYNDSNNPGPEFEIAIYDSSFVASSYTTLDFVL